MPRPLVSVVIPTRDRPALLAAAVDSVLAQSLAALEVVVCEDASGGAAPADLSCADGRVRRIEIRDGGRPSVVRNRGIVQARGEYIAFLDDDDLWEPRKLEYQVSALVDDHAAGFAYSDARLLFDDGSLSDPVLARKPAGVGTLTLRLLGDCFIHPSTVVVRRDLLERVGGFDESLPIAEDYDLWLRLAEVADAVYVPTPLVQVRRHAGSHSSTNQRLIYESTVRVLERRLKRGRLSLRERLRARRALARARARARACD